jgi:hypothetical protein
MNPLACSLYLRASAFLPAGTGWPTDADGAHRWAAASSTAGFWDAAAVAGTAATATTAATGSSTGVHVSAAATAAFAIAASVSAGISTTKTYNTSGVHITSYTFCITTRHPFSASTRHPLSGSSFFTPINTGTAINPHPSCL